MFLLIKNTYVYVLMQLLCLKQRGCLYLYFKTFFFIFYFRICQKHLILRKYYFRYISSSILKRDVVFYNNKNNYSYNVFVLKSKVLKFQRISAKHFIVKIQIKFVFATACNTYCIIHCKIQMNFLTISQKLITLMTLVKSVIEMLFIIDYSMCSFI